MKAAEKQKVDSQCRVIKKEWTTKYFLTKVGSTAICLISQKNIDVLKECNICRHFYSSHANYCSSLSTQQQEIISQKLVANFQYQQNTLLQQSVVHVSITKTSFFYWLLKWQDIRILFFDEEFIKQFVVETKTQHKQISLSSRTVTLCMEQIDERLANKLKGKADSFVFYLLALNKSNDVRDTTQLLIFVREVKDNFEIVEELIAIELPKETIR